MPIQKLTVPFTERIRSSRQPLFFTQAFRPLFLAAGSWAIVDIVLWLGMLFGYLLLPTRFDPLAWHIHEMLFGFVMAAVGGFLLTAIPNWTGRAPVSRRLVAMLGLMWMIGRIVCISSRYLPAGAVIAGDLIYPISLLAIASREIILSRNPSWRNAAPIAVLILFLLAEILMDLETVGLAVPVGLGWRLGMASPVLLIAVIGGRIIPAFTRNWLIKRNQADLPANPGPLDGWAIGLLAVGLVGWALLPGLRVVGVILLVAATANGWRLGRWKGFSTWPEPLLFILHAGYAWIAVGSALLGLSILTERVPLSSAIHALTAGAIGTMIIAVMPRVTRGHTGGELSADRPTTVSFALITAAALARVAASWATSEMMILLIVSAGCWIGAFTLFEIAYGPILLKKPT
jgi:uncharacterized protein involved in response to NO